MKYYLVGIKGTGMSSLAKLLKDLGNDVVGSDIEKYFFTEDSLKENEINIYRFNKGNILKDYFYIISNAYNETNEEVCEIIKNDYQYMYYHEFIATMLNKDVIACSGTHGKTTISYFITNFLNYKCSYIIGDGEGGGFNDNDLLVLEACEYKNHFSVYKPKILIINNIDLDHTDYYKNKKMLIRAFKEIASNSKILLVNGDDKNIKKIKHSHKITYGFGKKCNIRIKILSQAKKCYYVKVSYNNENIYLKIPFLGKHMIYNYVAGYMACILYGIKPNEKNVNALPKKRMETRKIDNLILISDYAHHPTEINALFESIKLTYPEKKINVIFQSHTYERTIKFKKQFKRSLNKFDKVYLMDVYSSRREQMSFVKQKKIDRYFNCFEKYNDTIINSIKKSSDVWVLLGAGCASDVSNLL